MKPYVFLLGLFLAGSTLPPVNSHANQTVAGKASLNDDLSRWTRNLSAQTPNGERWTDYHPEIAVSGNTVHILFLTNTESTRRACYTRSTDNGETWETPRVVFEDNDIIDNSEYRRLAVDGNLVHIAITYYSGEGGNWHGMLTYLRSTDGGTTFQDPKILVNADTAWHVYDLRVSADEGRISIGYNLKANWYDNYSIHLYDSSDGGTTFTDHMVTGDTGQNGSLQEMVRAGDSIHLLYYHMDENYSYGHWQARVGYVSSPDGGATFATTWMSTKATNGENLAYSLFDQHYAPNLVVTGNTVAAVWCQNMTAYNSPDRAVYARISTDGGRTFSEALRMSEGLPDGITIQVGQETIAALGNHIYCAFTAENGNIYLRRSQNDGLTFAPLQEVTSAAESQFTRTGWWPLAQADPNDPTGATLHLLWNYPTYCSSINGGASFTGPALLSPHFSWAGGGCNRPGMAIGSDGTIHTVVEGLFYANNAFGDADIFYRRFGSAPQPSPGNKALSLTFDADNWNVNARYDCMQIPAGPPVNFTSSMSAEIWVRPTAGSRNDLRVLLKEEAPLSRLWEPAGYQIGTYGTINGRGANAGILTTSGRHLLSGSDTALVPDATWTHLAITYDALGGDDNFRLYVNGALAASKTVTGDLVTGDGILFLGGNGSADGYNGLLDELRLWNRALAPAEIYNHARQSVSSQQGLTAWYGFDGTTRESTGQWKDGILMYREEFVPAENVLDADSATGDTPAAFFLSQNYPNPFNPSTVICFTLPRAENVQLEIYDSLGQLTAALVDGYHAAGRYEVSFNGLGLASGIYFCRLRAGDYSASRKLLLLK